MDLEKECEDHMKALQHLIQNAFHSIDNLSTNTQTPLAEYYNQVINLQEEDQRNLQDLKENIEQLENTHETTKHHLASLEKKLEVLKKEKETLQEQKSLKRKRLTTVKKNHAIKQNNVLKIKRCLAKDSGNQLTLDRNRKELLLYKQMTGISWDFAAPEELVKGFITNKETSYLKSFCFNNTGMKSQEIAEAMWNIISLSSLQQSEQS